jgi:hypothetical protein
MTRNKFHSSRAIAIIAAQRNTFSTIPNQGSSRSFEIVCGCARLSGALRFNLRHENRYPSWKTRSSRKHEHGKIERGKMGV